jgi:glycosyltransferase involved in cell wall biosynthesis
MLAGGLERAGAGVALLTRDHDLEFGAEPGAAERVIGAAIGDGVVHRAVPGPVRSPRGWASALRLRRELRGFAPDVVHLQESICNDVRLPWAAGAKRGRYALTVHDPVPHPGDGVPRRVVRANNALVRGAGLIFIHAEALREELMDLLGPRAPVVVVPHGIEIRDPEPFPDALSVLFFGRISHYKGIDVLLDAMGRVWGEIPAATLTIAGEGPLESHPALADPRVTVKSGHIPDAEVPDLFNAARCIALPYRQASQSGVGSRVKPYARPLVVTETGGLPELVSDGSGLVVPPEDPGKLAEALVSVLSDADLATRLGAAGAATAKREGSWDAVADLTLAAYREHLGVGE